MSAWLLALVSVIYLVAGAGFVFEQKWGLALFCLGCVVANAGLLLTARS